MVANPKRFPLRVILTVGIPVLVLLIFAVVDFSPNLRHLDARILSGPASGAYHAMVRDLAAAADDDSGGVINIESAGTVDNLERLVVAAENCSLEYALVQDGIAATESVKLELIARLRKSESVFVIGRDASAVTDFASLRGVTIGVGPKGSGSEHLARQLFGEGPLSPLSTVLVNHSIDEQLALLQGGTLAFGVFVVDEDAELIRRATTELGLEIARFAHWDVITRKFDHLWHGRIGAGQFDPIAMIPSADVRVPRVDTLVVGNGCASRTETIALLSLLSREFPSLIEHNVKRGTSVHFARSEVAESFYEAGGPGLLEQHVPWVVDIMAPANWVRVIMVISIFFNVMTFGHRFRLWRLDANRDKVDQVVRDIVSAQLTAEEIQVLEPRPEILKEKTISTLADCIREYEKLRRTCQMQANSMLVPMGQEGSYRYQEDQIDDMLTAVRAFRDRVVVASASSRP